MSRRNLVIAAAVGLAVLTAAWYSTFAPRAGNPVVPGAATEVAVTATATGSGGWVRYLVNVKDVADGDFDGSVLLIDVAAAPGGGQAAPVPSLTVPPRSAAEVAAQSAYEVHLFVPSRMSRTVAIIAPDGFNYVQAIQNGDVLDDGPVDRPPYLSVAVLSDTEVAAQDIAALHLDRYQPRVAGFTSAAQFPQSALLLAGYSMIVVDGFDTATLSGAQVQALRDFTGLGGTLVLAGGRGWRRTISPLPADLVAIRPVSTEPVSMRPVAALAGVTAPELDAPVAVGSMAQGARGLVAAPDGTPLAAELERGSGRVVQIAYDPAADPLAGTAYAGLGWSQAIGRGVRDLVSASPAPAWLLGPDPAFTALLPSAGDAPLPWPPLALAVLIGYMLVVGPLTYWFVGHRLARPGLFWLAVPLIASGFAALFYGSGQLLQGSLQVRQLQVIEVAPGGTAGLLEYDRVLFLRRGTHELELRPDSIAAPMTLDTFQVTGSTCERCTSQLQGLTSGAERVLPGPRPVVEESGVVYGSVRVVGSTTVVRLSEGVQARLKVVGGRVQGVVANIGADAVANLALYAHDGQSFEVAPLPGVLAAGAKITVDAPLAPIPAGGRPPSGVDPLVTAVGVTTVASQGGVVLAGLTRPIASGIAVDGETPAGLAAAVFEQPVELESADGSLRGFERKELAGTVGDQAQGYTDVYDLRLPPAASPLTLSVNPEFVDPAHVEVYDWKRGAFEPVVLPPSAGTGATVPLNADQVGAGVVRVRLHEPRVLWGASLWVDVAGSPVPGA